MATAGLDDAVRARIRQLRFERALSLRQLEATTGISAATLSRIETGARRLSLDQLGALAGALGVEVADFLMPSAAQPRPRAQDGRAWEPIGPEHVDGRRVYRVEIAAGTQPHLHSHEGHQWLYVLEGRLRLVVEDDDRILQRGDAAEFDTWRPHWVGGVDGPADTLAIFSPVGDPLRAVAAGQLRRDAP